MPTALRTEANAAWKECFRLPETYNIQLMYKMQVLL
jgi:hypothetical protein